MTASSPKASQDLFIDRFDIVATQGAYLVTRPRTPLSFEKPFDEQFVFQLASSLRALVTVVQESRKRKYHGAADEWPIGYTPPELKEKRKAELKAWEDLAGVSSDDSSDDDGDEKDQNKGGHFVSATAGPEKPVVGPKQLQSPQRPRQADWPPTPPLSAERPPITPHRRKRWRVWEEDDEENQRPTKKHVSCGRKVPAPMYDAIPKTSQQKGRKRQPTSNAGHGEWKRKKPNKTGFTTSSIWTGRLRPRPPAVDNG